MTKIEIDDKFVDYLNGLGDEEKIKLLHKCMLAGVVVCYEANAETFEYEMESVTISDKYIGKYKITVEKL